MLVFEFEWKGTKTLCLVPSISNSPPYLPLYDKTLPNRKTEVWRQPREMVAKKGSGIVAAQNAEE